MSNTSTDAHGAAGAAKGLSLKKRSVEALRRLSLSVRHCEPSSLFGSRYVRLLFETTTKRNGKGIDSVRYGLLSYRERRKFFENSKDREIKVISGGLGPFSERSRRFTNDEGGLGPFSATQAVLDRSQNLLVVLTKDKRNFVRFTKVLARRPRVVLRVSLIQARRPRVVLRVSLIQSRRPRVVLRVSLIQSRRPRVVLWVLSLITVARGGVDQGSNTARDLFQKGRNKSAIFCNHWRHAAESSCRTAKTIHAQTCRKQIGRTILTIRIRITKLNGRTILR